MIRLHDVVPRFDFCITGGGAYVLTGFPEDCSFLDFFYGYANAVYRSETREVLSISIMTGENKFLFWVDPSYLEAFKGEVLNTESPAYDPDMVIHFCTLEEIWGILEFDQRVREQIEEKRT